MFFKLFLAFTLIPVLELYLLIKVGGQLGAATTIMIVIVTGIAGAYLARMQGFITMTKVRENMSQGITPAEELIDGVLILAAGAVLLTPGFITDALGLLLLIPFTRNLFKRWLRKKFQDWSSRGTITVRRYPY